MYLQFRENGGIEPLVKLLQSGNDEVRRNASWAINICAVDEPTSIAICAHGYVCLVYSTNCVYMYMHMYAIDL